MSNRWPGGLVRKTPVTPTGPLQNGAAPGIWSLAEASYWTKQGLWPTAGNFLAVEDVFSTYLYTGTGSAQTITNGIDLAGKGGLVWIKSRSSTVYHNLVDTARGNTSYIYSNASDQADVLSTRVTSFNSDGFTLGPTVGTNPLSNSGVTYASWTFREAPKFFDVVTWTGDGVSGRQIAHALGVAPGMILVKCTNNTADWGGYHRSLGATKYVTINQTWPAYTSTGYWNDTEPTATNFTVGNSFQTNNSGWTYVAYLFAHDTTSDGIIQCGSFTTDGSGNATVNLGWEPQWILSKKSSDVGSWFIVDTMRGMPVGSNDAQLLPNTSGAEISPGDIIDPTATGFLAKNISSSTTYIYIAIRRGPMRTPTSGTSVFSPNTFNSASGTAITTGFPVDTHFSRYRGSADDTFVYDRLRGLNSTTTNGSQPYLATNSTNAEGTITVIDYGFNNTGYLVGGYYASTSTIGWSFRRAPSFFDEVCWKFDGVDDYPIINHNLGKVPELIIMKDRTDASTDWMVMPNVSPYSNLYKLALNKTDAISAANSNWWTSFSPTSTQFRVDRSFAGGYPSGAIPSSTASMVAYLFASCPGVSKVGSYTGNGSSQTINCGFTTGARFFLVKRTDSTGDWWVWDSARGITAPADPALRWNTSAVEVTSADATDPDNSGIIVNQEGTCNINVNGGTYIFLAVA